MPGSAVQGVLTRTRMKRHGTSSHAVLPYGGSPSMLTFMLWISTLQKQGHYNRYDALSVSTGTGASCASRRIRLSHAMNQRQHTGKIRLFKSGVVVKNAVIHRTAWKSTMNALRPFPGWRGSFGYTSCWLWQASVRLRSVQSTEHIASGCILGGVSYTQEQCLRPSPYGKSAATLSWAQLYRQRVELNSTRMFAILPTRISDTSYTQASCVIGKSWHVHF